MIIQWILKKNAIKLFKENHYFKYNYNRLLRKFNSLVYINDFYLYSLKDSYMSWLIRLFRINTYIPNQFHDHDHDLGQNQNQNQNQDQGQDQDQEQEHDNFSDTDIMKNLNLTQYEQSFLNNINDSSQLFQNYQFDNSFNNPTNNYEITENLVGRLNNLITKHQGAEKRPEIDSTTQFLINKSLSTTNKLHHDSHDFNDLDMYSILDINDEISLTGNKLSFKNSHNGGDKQSQQHS